MMIYGAGFVQVFMWSLVSRWLKAICQFDPPVETMVLVIYKARLHYVATILPNQCQKDYIQIHGRKIDKFTVQFVSWSQYMVRTFLTWGTCGFSSVLKWLAVPLPLHSPQHCMFFEFIFCMFASFAVTWGTHKVAFACCVTRGCKIPRRKCTCIG